MPRRSARPASTSRRLSPEEAAAKIMARPGPVALALVAFLDDWGSARVARRNDPAGSESVSAAARLADPDPGADQLRQELEQPRGADRTAALRRLAQGARLDDWPAVNLHLLGRALTNAGEAGGAETVLRHGQRRHPGDVWLNYDLARCLEKLAPATRRFATTRPPARFDPETAHELAHALEDKGETDEAIAVFQDLARLQSSNGRNLTCWGRARLARGPVQGGRVSP